MARKDKVVTPSVTQKLQDLGYNVADWDDSQTSSKLTPDIIKVLNQSSKSQNGSNGYPDRIYCNKNHRLLILVEEKPTIEAHDFPSIKDGTVEGVKWYLSQFLFEDFSSWKIIGIAVSGDLFDEYKSKFSCFCIKKSEIIHVDNVKGFLKEDEFLAIFNNLDEESAIANVSKVSKKINKLLRSIDSQKRPIILASLMISLYRPKDDYNNFPDLYKKYTSEQILNNLYPTISNILSSEGIPKEKLRVLELELNTINHDPILKTTNILRQILDELEKNIIPLFNNSFSTNSNYDIMGKFYEEFLRFAGVSNVKKGIVLTPRHITSLFTKLVPFKTNDIVLDLCCGTGAFLIAGMNKLLSLDGVDQENVKSDQLIGFEVNSTMYICAISNMLFRGDGKSRIYNMDSINDPEAEKKINEIRPTIGFINPPYSGKENKDDPTPKEISFLKKILDYCSRYVVIISPLSMYFKDTEIRKKILEKHTLKYVINMPKDLFQPNAATNTAVAVFETHIPHNFKKHVIFYDLQDDGFILSKNKGRTDLYNKWNDIEKAMLDEINSGKKSDNITISRVKIKKNDEWNIYAHSTPDYSTLTDRDFCSTINDYVLFTAKKQLGLQDKSISEFDMLSAVNSYINDKLEKLEKITHVNKLELFSKDNSWKMFNIYDVFDKIENTKGETTYDLLDGNDIPYIAAKKKDNGFDYFVSREGNEDFISEGNGIVFINLGDGSGGYSTYQPDDFIGMSGKTSVGYAKKLNKYTALFLITILDKQRYKYSFGRSWNSTRFKNTQLYLPCDSTGNIHWDFMEKYILSLPNGNIL
ncbi:N-6 DNA methylase [Histophilus somni]|uniref:N-6 DNA methylase n=1 Tax=Histophilus somni TaxID=731 RepID=UPI00201EC614|nr:N-6 DNA methylase [Histophilus somni]